PSLGSAHLDALESGFRSGCPKTSESRSDSIGTAFGNRRNPHVLAQAQRTALEAASVQVEHDAGLAPEVGVAREDPAAMGPRPQGILRQPAPDGRPGDLRDDALADGLGADVGYVQAREGQLELPRRGAGDGLHRDDRVRGKRTAASPGAAGPPGPRDVPRRSTCATSSPRRRWYPGAGRSRRSGGPRPRGARSWRARPRGARASACGRAAPAPRALWGRGG